MDKIIEGVGTFLITQGWSGIAFLVVCVACWRLFGLYVTLSTQLTVQVTAALTEAAKSAESSARVLEALKDELIRSPRGGRK